MIKPVLRLDNLFKSYGKTEAVRGISLDIRRGICFGLLGPNGAGKSTLIELIEQLIPPDLGAITYDGRQLPFPQFFEELGFNFNKPACSPC